MNATPTPRGVPSSTSRTTTRPIANHLPASTAVERGRLSAASVSAQVAARIW
jgi:hypothetical protein